MAMIPQDLTDFIQGAVVSWVGSRDDRLRPSVSWAFGARVKAADDLITTFVPDIEADQIKADFTGNGMITFTVVQGISHEAYQFKGRVVELRPTTDEERAVQDIHRSKLISFYSVFPEVLFTGFKLYPSTAVTFRVEEAFVQTPGPGAGDRLEFGAGTV